MVLSQLGDPSMVPLGGLLSGIGFVHLSCLEFVSLTLLDLDCACQVLNACQFDRFLF